MTDERGFVSRIRHAQMSLANRTLAGAIVDSSALMCILLDEAAAPFFMAGLQSTGQLYIGAATRAETWLAASNAKAKRAEWCHRQSLRNRRPRIPTSRMSWGAKSGLNLAVSILASAFTKTKNR